MVDHNPTAIEPSRKCPEYKVWASMKNRCYNPKDRRSWLPYGGRGITICERWRNSFAAFLADMGRRPSPQHQLDRIDNDGPYCPENCRWATRKEQANNRRNNHFITHDGVTLTLTQWAERTGIPYGTLKARLKAGWVEGDVVSRPLDRKYSFPRLAATKG